MVYISLLTKYCFLILFIVCCIELVLLSINFFWNNKELFFYPTPDNDINKYYSTKNNVNQFSNVKCNKFLFKLNFLPKDKPLLLNLYNEIKNLKERLFIENKKYCIKVDFKHNNTITRKNNVYVESNNILFYNLKLNEIKIIGNNTIIKKIFIIDPDYFTSNNSDIIKTKSYLANNKIIKKYKNYCKVLNPVDLDKLLITLLLSKCIPVINAKWSTDLLLIDKEFKWSKALIIQDEIDFSNSEYFYTYPLSQYDVEEKIKYGQKLLSWNFKILSPIASNILTFLEKRYTGNVFNKLIKADNLYNEDEELFDIERSKPLVNDKFTIMMTTYKRIQGLNYSLAQFNNNTDVDKIIVIWNDPDLSYLPKKHFWSKSVAPAFFVKPNANSLNNKFLPYDIIKTEAILILDDDQRLSEELLKYLFNVWKFNRDVIVGYNRRLTGNGPGNAYFTSGLKKFDLILTSLSFLNKKYLYYYTYNFPTKFKEKIDFLTNCEDISMNYLVAMYSNKPNIAYTIGGDLSRCYNCTSHGLSSKSNHYKIRSDCVLELNKIFGFNPMIPNSFYLKEFIN
uniref:Glyco_transf_64 domain-containing protein n=1 Tax=Strongyloides stercoralis TaxID=6248 RepID=A0AAF5DLH2_STRER